jgi:hypothetical protein
MFDASAVFHCISLIQFCGWVCYVVGTAMVCLNLNLGGQLCCIYAGMFGIYVLIHLHWILINTSTTLMCNMYAIPGS